MCLFEGRPFGRRFSGVLVGFRDLQAGRGCVEVVSDIINCIHDGPARLARGQFLHALSWTSRPRRILPPPQGPRTRRPLSWKRQTSRFLTDLKKRHVGARAPYIGGERGRYSCRQSTQLQYLCMPNSLTRERWLPSLLHAVRALRLHMRAAAVFTCG